MRAGSGKPDRSARRIYARRSSVDRCRTPGEPERTLSSHDVDVVLRSISRSVRPNIARRTSRPVPGQVGASMSPRTDPVTRNWPLSGAASTASLTAWSDAGTSCHSSISTGFGSPSRTERGSTAKPLATRGSPRRTTDPACRSHEVVFPVARGPTTRTAAWSETISARTESASLGRYERSITTQTSRCAHRWLVAVHALD